MRNSLLIFSSWFLLCNFSIFAQSKTDLEQKYGEPFTKTETTQSFNIRRNLILQVTYSGNEADKFQVYPVKSKRTITSELSKELSEEIFPTSKRLFKINDITFSGGCSSSRSIIYRNVTISESINCVIGITQIHIKRAYIANTDIHYLLTNEYRDKRFLVQNIFSKTEEPQFLRLYKINLINHL